MTYHEVSLSPTRGQADDLSQGTLVKLSPEHLSAGECTFFLTTSQCKKIAAQTTEDFSKVFHQVKLFTKI